MSLRHGMDSWHVICCSLRPESPSQDNRTSHWSRHGPDEHWKSLRKRWPMVTLCSKHKNDPSKGQIGRGQHPKVGPKRRKTIMHDTISEIPGGIPGGIYRPEFLKPNLTMTARHYSGQWPGPPGCVSLCPYKSVTPKPCSLGSLNCLLFR
jgi:hypothetical protein